MEPAAQNSNIDTVQMVQSILNSLLDQHWPIAQEEATEEQTQHDLKNDKKTPAPASNSPKNTPQNAANPLGKSPFVMPLKRPKTVLAKAGRQVIGKNSNTKAFKPQVNLKRPEVHKKAIVNNKKLNQAPQRPTGPVLVPLKNTQAAQAKEPSPCDKATYSNKATQRATNPRVIGKEAPKRRACDDSAEAEIQNSTKRTKMIPQSKLINTKRTRTERVTNDIVQPKAEKGPSNLPKKSGDSNKVLAETVPQEPSKTPFKVALKKFTSIMKNTPTEAKSAPPTTTKGNNTTIVKIKLQDMKSPRATQALRQLPEKFSSQTQLEDLANGSAQGQMKPKPSNSLRWTHNLRVVVKRHPLLDMIATDDSGCENIIKLTKRGQNRTRLGSSNCRNISKQAEKGAYKRPNTEISAHKKVYSSTSMTTQADYRKKAFEVICID